MLTVADRGRGKICQNLADVICERSLCERPCIQDTLSSRALGLAAARAKVYCIQ